MHEGDNSMTHEQREARQRPLAIRRHNNNIGQITIDAELWAAVERSEKHQRWCIEDAGGECLMHPDCVHGREASKEAGPRTCRNHDPRWPHAGSRNSTAKSRRAVERKTREARKATGSDPAQTGARRTRPPVFRSRGERMEGPARRGRTAATL